MARKSRCRLSVWPRSQLSEVGETLASCGVHFDPKGFDEVISVFCHGDGSFSVGVKHGCAAFDIMNDGTTAESESLPICRAQHKLEELAWVSSEFTSFLQSCAEQPTWALDVGASPGGWTAYLSDVPGVSVVACDPGEIDPAVLARPNVEHACSKVEVSALEYEAKSGSERKS